MSGFDWLLCPQCGNGLVVEDRAARCDRGHSVDRARQGYLNLLGRAQGANADTPDMVARRHAFLSSGHYSPIADAVSQRSSGSAAVVEVGAGTGWYLARVLDALPSAEGLGVDVSVAAAKRLAKCHPRARAIVADAWQPLPIASAVADVVLSIFAPRNPEEFARVLGPKGRLVVVTPRADHLREARERFGLLGIEADKQQRLASTLGPWFTETEAEDLDVPMVLAPGELVNLVGMGPNAFHDHSADVQEPFEVTARVRISSWQKR